VGSEMCIRDSSKDFPKPQLPVISLTAKELKKFTGYYAPRAPRNQLLAFTQDLTGGTWIRVADGKLQCYGLFGKRREVLLPVGKNLFRGEKEPEATTVFFPDANGRMIYVRSSGEPYGERIIPLWPYLRLLLLAASAVVMASALPYALFWGFLPLLRKLIKRLKRVRHLRVRVVPLFAVLSLVGVLYTFSKVTDDIGELNLWSFLIFVGTVVFALLSLASLAVAVSVPPAEIHKAVRIHSLLVSLACCIVTLFFSSWHLIGLRLWAP